MATPATIERLCAEFDSPPEHITAAAGLLEAGASPAYLARFQRFALGSLPEDRLHAIAERLHALNELDQRKAAILQQAEERGKKTAELEAIVATSVDQDLIDDLYQSMRPRRRGPAMQMEEKGLLPLAMALQHRQLGEQSLQDVAAAYVAADKGLPSPENVLEGALLILSERIASDPTTRARFRGELKHGILKARAVNPDTTGNEQSSRYKDLFNFAEPIHRIPAGRMLALRRAEREGIVALELTLPDGRARQLLRELHGKDLADDSPLLEFFHLVYDHAAQQLQEWCGKDVRRRLKEKADREAVRTYARNLRSQLLAPPLGSKKVLALRTSSKAIWAVLLGEDGAVDEHKTLPTETDEQKQGAIAWLVELIKGKQPAAIALPHGRRQAGSERVVAELRTALGETPMPMVVPVDEAASTIFATSTAGKKAIPGVEVGVRTAISLGRRLQDPLLELSRMDMRTLGIGQTLDDVHQGMLQRELADTASSCLAQIGVDLNTVGQDLLELIPGLDGEKAKAILDRRRSIGGFRSRAQLAEVPGLDAATVRNVQGFVRVLGGDEPLDATGVHPDDYAIARAAAEKRGCQPIDMLGQNLRDTPIDEMTTAEWPRQRIIHVLQALMRGNADSRGELVATQNAGVNSLADLHADRELKGRIASLTEFGAFVDLGVGQDGLVHISQIPGDRLRDPQQQLRVGEVVTVWVLNVDQDKQKIGLTMYMPRHLREGRRPTLGERMDQQQGRRQRPEGGPGGPGGERRDRGDRGDRGQRGDRREPAGPPGRFAGASRIGKRQPPAEPGKEGGDRPRFGRDRDDSSYDDRGPRSRGPRDQRVYTVEPAREAADQRTHKGEFTSLANLRALLGGGKKADAPADAPKSPDA